MSSRRVGLGGGVEEYFKKGRGGPQSGVNFLQGDDTGGAPIWLIYLGFIGSNGYNSGR